MSESRNPRGQTTAEATSGVVWVATALAGASLVLVVVNMVLALGNEQARTAVNARQQFINQNAQAGSLDSALIRALVGEAVNNGNAEIQALLTRAGVNYAPNAPAAAGAGEAPSPTAPAPAEPSGTAAPAAPPAGKP